MIINNNRINTNHPVTFKGPLDGVITNTLRVLDTNPMANAVGLDLISMVGPRTYVDTKERNKYAGAETFFREFTGTLIVCLSASYFAKGITYLANRVINPEIPINSNSWLSNEGIKFLHSEWEQTNNSKDFINSVLNSITGKDGKTTRKFSQIDWNNIDWTDEKRWNKFKWENPKFNNIHTKLKTHDDIVSIINEMILNKNISKNDYTNLIKILELRLTNALKADKITAQNSKSETSTTIHNLLRDMTDLGRDVFTNTKISSTKTLEKIVKINKIKSLGALTIASTLGLFNQYVNRKITEKRTGTKGFVGDTNYKDQVKNKKSTKDKSLKFILKKIAASFGMAAMAIAVMRIKSPKDFLKKLEFTGPVTSGNAIKTVYASTLIGRFLASDNKDELRETVTRDYLGFLNWLAFGGFAAKGIANLLDPEKKSLFNISKDGKGIKHWLNDISLKSHNEIAAQGKKFANKNMWKTNLAQFGGLAYSTIALGILLPKLNIVITKNKQKNKTTHTQPNNNVTFGTNTTLEKFMGLKSDNK